MNTSAPQDREIAGKEDGAVKLPMKEFVVGEEPGSLMGEREAAREKAALELAHKAKTKSVQLVEISERGSKRQYEVARLGWGPVKTAEGKFHHLPFSVNDEWLEYQCLVKADAWESDLLPRFHNPLQLLVRIDSGCVGGMIFGADDCDCRKQLTKAREMIAAVGEGIIVHIARQDGRGMGTNFKTSTQVLQDELGWDTVKAAQRLACSQHVDLRTFGGAVAVLKFLLRSRGGVRLRLMSGSPSKKAALTENDFVVDFDPPDVPVTPETAANLAAKAKLWGHIVPGLGLGG